uniref:BZIP domain-containing protein n=1 Tax=Prolemur simus TaxID=1328070 RepID=A0A8C9DQG0_PROSS
QTIPSAPLSLYCSPLCLHPALQPNSHSTCPLHWGPAMRRQREFMPEEKKDTVYWEKRRKNNEAAKRSREKRRLNDAAIEDRLAALMEENTLLRAELRFLPALLSDCQRQRGENELKMLMGSCFSVLSTKVLRHIPDEP